MVFTLEFLISGYETVYCEGGPGATWASNKKTKAEFRLDDTAGVIRFLIDCKYWNAHEAAEAVAKGGTAA